MTPTLAVVLGAAVIIGLMVGSAVIAVIHEAAKRTKIAARNSAAQRVWRKRVTEALERIIKLLNGGERDGVGFKWEEINDDKR